MKTNQKQEYSSPRMEIISINNESLLGGASIAAENNNAFKKEDYTTSGGEHNGGEAEWQKMFSFQGKDVSNKSFDTSFFYVVIFALLRIVVYH